MPSASLYTPSMTNVARADAAELAEQAEPKLPPRKVAEPEKLESAQPKAEATIALSMGQVATETESNVPASQSSIREQKDKRKGRKRRKVEMTPAARTSRKIGKTGKIEQ